MRWIISFQRSKTREKRICIFKNWHIVSWKYGKNVQLNSILIYTVSPDSLTPFSVRWTCPQPLFSPINFQNPTFLQNPVRSKVSFHNSSATNALFFMWYPIKTCSCFWWQIQSLNCICHWTSLLWFTIHLPYMAGAVFYSYSYP